MVWGSTMGISMVAHHLCDLILLMLRLTYTFDYGSTFNIDTNHSLIFGTPASSHARGRRGSFFGVSVTLHQNRQGIWLLVGAPRANSTTGEQKRLVEPGALFRCHLPGSSCEQVPIDEKGNERKYDGSGNILMYDQKDGQWLGVSMDNQDTGKEKRITICGHLWADKKYNTKLPANGMCYHMNEDFGNVDRKPPFNTGESITGALAGFSLKYMQSGKLLMGAPGIDDRFGGFLVDSHARRPAKSYPKLTDEYFGYSVTGGKFVESKGTLVVVGAPRRMNTGKVVVFDDAFKVLYELAGDQMGSYFGSSLCSVDLNADGVDDLVVGAPMYTKNVMDQGLAYVFVSDGKGSFQQKMKIWGGNVAEARFGSAVTVAGDLNRDGFPDILIGAPHEDHHTGTVYLYHGNDVTGLRRQHSQRIAASSLNRNLRGFGCALSRKKDIDGNTYPDVAVGAYLSDQAVVLRTRVLVNPECKLEIQPPVIDQGIKTCDQNTKTCVNITMTCSYRDTSAPAAIALKYKVTLDTRKRVSRISWLTNQHFSGENVLHLKKDFASSTSWTAVFRTKAKDELNPLEVELRYINISVNATQTSSFPPLSPLLNRENITSVVAKANFKKECGDDNKCVSDLAIDMKPKLFLGKPYIIFGASPDIKLEVSAKNRGEAAYFVNLLIFLPPAIEYHEMRKIAPSSVVTCDPDVRFSVQLWGKPSLICETVNPLLRDSSVHFELILHLTKLTAVTQSLNITTRSQTTSHVADTSQSESHVMLPVKMVATIKANIVSQPRELSHKHGDQEIKEIGNRTVPREGNIYDLKHVYDVTNIGPGSLPPVRLELFLPYTRPHFPKSFLKDIQVTIKNSEGSQNCAESDEGNTTRTNHNSKGHDWTTEANVMYLDCTTALCLKYVCNVGWMQAKGTVVVTATFLARLSVLRHGQRNNNTVRLISTLKVEKPTGLYVTHWTDTYKATTILYLKGKPAKPVPMWIIGLSVGCGVLLVIIIFVGLKKCGFFERKVQHDLKRLKRQSITRRENQSHELPADDCQFQPSHNKTTG